MHRTLSLAKNSPAIAAAAPGACGDDVDHPGREASFLGDLGDHEAR
jgi:hypothetical protein